MPLTKHAATPKVALKNNSLANKPQVLSSDALQGGEDVGGPPSSRLRSGKRRGEDAIADYNPHEKYSAPPQNTSGRPKFHLVWWNVQSKNNLLGTNSSKNEVVRNVGESIAGFFKNGCDAVFLIEVTHLHQELVAYVKDKVPNGINHYFNPNADRRQNVSRCSYLLLYGMDCEISEIEAVGQADVVKRPALRFRHGDRHYYGVHLVAYKKKAWQEILDFTNESNESNDTKAFVFGDVNHDVREKIGEFGEHKLLGHFKPIRMDGIEYTHSKGGMLDGAYTNTPGEALVYDPLPDYSFKPPNNLIKYCPPDHKPIGLKIY